MNKPIITHLMLDTSCANEFLDPSPDYALIA